MAIGAFVTTAVLVGMGAGIWWSVSQARAGVWQRGVESFNRLAVGPFAREVAFLIVAAVTWVLPFMALLLLPYEVAAKFSGRVVLASPDTVVGTILVSGLLPVVPFVVAWLSYRIAERWPRERSPN